jgi:hypothetical protein
MKKPPPVDGADRDTGHIRIPQHIIDIVNGKDSPEEMLE